MGMLVIWGWHLREDATDVKRHGLPFNGEGLRVHALLKGEAWLLQGKGGGAGCVGREVPG